MVQEPEINAFSIDRSESALRERLELSLWRIENLEYDIHEKAREYFQTEASLLSGRIRTEGGGQESAEPEDPFLCHGYCREIFGREMGNLMSAWSYELRRLSEPAACRDIAAAAAEAETLIQIYNAFEEAYLEDKDSLPRAEHIKDIIYSYIYDYSEGFISGYLRGTAGEGIMETGLSAVFTEGPEGEDCRIRALHANDLSLFLGDRLGARILELLKNELRNHGKGRLKPVFKGAYEKVPGDAELSYSERQQRILVKIRTGFMKELQEITQ